MTISLGQTVRRRWSKRTTPHLQNMKWTAYLKGVEGSALIEKMHLVWVSMYLARKRTEDTTLSSPTGDGTDILRGHPSHAKVQPWSSPVCRAQAVPSFLTNFKPWVLVRPPGIELATMATRSEVKCSTDSGNPAAVERTRISFISSFATISLSGKLILLHFRISVNSYWFYRGT